jgi:cytochrome P450
MWHSVTLTVSLSPFPWSSITNTFPQWGLIELARRPKIQETIRAELRDAFTTGGDLTYDQLMNDLPYLDAFTCELLRIHLASPETMRVVRLFHSLLPPISTNL